MQGEKIKSRYEVEELLLVELASTRETFDKTGGKDAAATDAYARALREFNGFILDGVVPKWTESRRRSRFTKSASA